jgi:hypothetical protein
MRVTYTGPDRFTTYPERVHYASSDDVIVSCAALPGLQDDLEHGPAFKVSTARGWTFVVRADELAVAP